MGFSSAKRSEPVEMVKNILDASRVLVYLIIPEYVLKI